MGSVIAVGVIALAALFVISAGLKIVPQAQAAIVERLGRYRRTLEPGLHLLIPFADRIRANVDLREQVQSFPPQPVITEDNLVVNIDSVVYFQVTEARAAVYEIENFIQGIEQITVTTLRNVIGGMSLERTLTSRDDINQQLRGVLDEATGRWGIRVNRVELKSIDPPATIQQAMETQMRADRDKRAAILKAEGEKQSQILTAEGEQQSQVLRAQGERDAEVLRAEGQARAIKAVFQAIHEGRPDNELLAYQYLQALPKIAQGDSNKMWIVPSDFAQTLGTMGPMLGAITQAAQEGGPSKSAPPRGDDEGGTPALPPGNAPY
ncbi:MAG: SPFH domain-containing protein [Thermoleophilia bacterium]